MIKIKHIKDTVEPGDDRRILITRYWPRGTKKEDATWDSWQKELAPSEELHADWSGKSGKGITWARYYRRFLDEMERTTGLAAINELAEAHNQGQVITLLCHCEDELKCHCRLVKQILERSEQWFDVPDELHYPDKLDLLPATFGSYILEFNFSQRVAITPGALGRIRLGPGRHRYYGSAFGFGGLRSRVGHHLRKKKTLVGHADWLTVKETPTRVMITDYMTECGLFQRDLNSGEWEIAAEGFGTAGHSRDCEAHLLVAVDAPEMRGAS